MRETEQGKRGERGGKQRKTATKTGTESAWRKRLVEL